MSILPTLLASTLLRGAILFIIFAATALLWRRGWHQLQAHRLWWWCILLLILLPLQELPETLRIAPVQDKAVPIAGAAVWEWQLNWSDWLTPGAAPTLEAAQPTVEPVTPGDTLFTRDRLIHGCMVLYIGITLLLFGRRIGQFIHWHWRIRRLRRSDDPRLQRIFATVAVRCGVRPESVVLLDGEGLLAVPAGFGLRRRCLLIPTAARELPEEELGMLFAHELTHFRHHDHHINFALYWLETAFWFNPFFLRAVHGLRQAVELACDRQVFRQQPEIADMKSRYARMLLFFSSFKSPKSFAPGLGLTPRGRELQQRIMIMLKPSLPHSRWSIPGMAMLAVIALATLLLMPGFSSAQNPEPELFDYVPESTELLLYIDGKTMLSNTYLQQSFEVKQVRAQVLSYTNLPVADLPPDILANFRLLACMGRTDPNTTSFNHGIILLQSIGSWDEIKELLLERFPEKIQSQEIDGHEVLEFSVLTSDTTSQKQFRMGRLNDHLFALYEAATPSSFPQPRAAGVTSKILERLALVPKSAFAYLVSTVDLGSTVNDRRFQGLPAFYLVEESPEQLNCTIAFQVAPDQMESIGEHFRQITQQYDFIKASTDVANHTQLLTITFTPELFQTFLSQFNASKPATP